MSWYCCQCGMDNTPREFNEYCEFCDHEKCGACTN